MPTKEEKKRGVIYFRTITLGKVEVMMEKQLPYQEVHSEVMRVDKKFALPGYRAFCGCSRR